ncbi:MULTISPECIES: GNAT family N-acetyltransferase [Marinobacter]|uniref:GNAT family N-acetyltransferase n=1 Tax=Marinobacter xiaoshiensis TaxID=3073652 RepID=A0ABU2HHV6_9GAMM|nr:MULTISPECIES: GNAT family N-acetyltransferase [unclassified Marinobacter]MBK1874529.1 GNAT family N-acetyltransferase [Marinobacter sp. 1-3A]MBK1887839.1 GNAT family N-acetyltransferase [Marinobacter sp. DY40_1A1]MDS1310333.1 GNAT family N-acetyltransferase [Marinobacter sp. F60267]
MSGDNKKESDPVIVRLDISALNEARSILYDAYRDEPTFQYLFNHRKPGYKQRVRATVRELVDLYFDLNQESVGVMVNDTLVAVAFIGDPDLRLNLANQFSWRIRMVLTAGFASTRRYLHYHERIRAMLPQPLAHQLPLMGVNPKYQNRGYGRLLLQAVQRLCAENPRGTGLVLDTGNSRYLPFYESEGFRSLGKLRVGGFEDHILFREIHPEAKVAANQN